MAHAPPAAGGPPDHGQCPPPARERRRPSAGRLSTPKEAYRLMPLELPVIEPSRLSPGDVAALQSEIRRLAQERGAVVLAHNYQRPEVQDVADFVGDSLGLSREAAKTDAAVIVFCGVHFMAETAAILSPDKAVLLPDMAAGCSLADTITAEDVRRWKAEHPGAVVVL